MRDEHTTRDQIWNQMYRQIRQHFARYGQENAFGEGDFWVVDDNYGWRRHYVYLFNLELMTTLNVLALKKMLAGLPGWEIVMVIDMIEHENDWPPMGVTIRAHEIVDGLQRRYLPPALQNLVIPGSRPGTGYD